VWFLISEMRQKEMVEVWQRLADSYADATTSLSTPVQSEQPAMQQRA
jgi:hypothetical protein